MTGLGGCLAGGGGRCRTGLTAGAAGETRTLWEGPRRRDGLERCPSASTRSRAGSSHECCPSTSRRSLSAVRARLCTCRRAVKTRRAIYPRASPAHACGAGLQLEPLALVCAGLDALQHHPQLRHLRGQKTEAVHTLTVHCGAPPAAAPPAPPRPPCPPSRASPAASFRSRATQGPSAAPPPQVRAAGSSPLPVRGGGCLRCLRLCSSLCGRARLRRLRRAGHRACAAQAPGPCRANTQYRAVHQGQAPGPCRANTQYRAVHQGQAPGPCRAATRKGMHRRLPSHLPSWGDRASQRAGSVAPTRNSVATGRLRARGARTHLGLHRRQETLVHPGVIPVGCVCVCVCVCVRARGRAIRRRRPAHQPYGGETRPAPWRVRSGRAALARSRLAPRG